MSPLKMYQELLKTHFMLVQSGQTAGLMGFSDILAQKAVEKRAWKDFQVTRTLNFMLLGAVYVGPTITQWYKFLDKKVGSVSSPLNTAKKVAADQLLFAPSFLVVFVVAVGVLQRKDLTTIKNDLKAKYPDILMTNWKIWPAVQLINFSFMPLRFQVLFAQVVAVFWNTYLAWKTGSNDDEK